MTVVHLINRLPSTTLMLQSPINILEGLYPTVRLKTDLPIRIFGCVVYVRNPTYRKNKWSHKALKCVFLGYSTTQKGYKAYHPITRKYIVSKDVFFDEKQLYYTSNKTTGLRDLSYLQKLSNSPSTSPQSADAQTDNQPSLLLDFYNTDSQLLQDISQPISGQQEIMPLESETQEQINIPSYPKYYERRKKSSVPSEAHDDQQTEQSQGRGVLLQEGVSSLEGAELGWPIALRKKPRSCVKSVTHYLNFSNEVPQHKAFLLNIQDTTLPRTFHEAFKSFHWKEAMNEEMKALLQNATGRTPVITYQRRNKRVNKKNPKAGPTVDSCPYVVVDPLYKPGVGPGIKRSRSESILR